MYEAPAASDRRDFVSRPTRGNALRSRECSTVRARSAGHRPDREESCVVSCSSVARVRQSSFVPRSSQSGRHVTPSFEISQRSRNE